MNITIDQLMAKIGSLTVQVDYLVAENAKLKSALEASKTDVKEEPKETT